jgi:predicted DNA-binding protein
MSELEKRVDVRLPEHEFKILEEYCKVTGRTKTEVVRELVRNLRRRLPKNTELSGKSWIKL